MGRTILGVVVGLAVAMVVIFMVEGLATVISPPSPGLDLKNEADLARLVETANITMKVLVLLGWLLGSFVGAWVAAKVSRAHRVSAAIVVGIGIVLGVILNATMLPHPLWMTALGIALPIPLAWFAARLATPRATL